ncbi:MAG: E3 binding domain-containing protein, partial [Chloroflexi bacterium]|nr:E3 binding domain-containing protein [Chloroflexota bacterium]
MVKVTMPQLGESVTEGTIGRWLKQPGDTVAKYEALVEVVTDKVNAEVPSPYAGILREILAPEGSVVPNDADIAVIETEEEAASGVSAAAAAPSPAPMTSPAAMTNPAASLAPAPATEPVGTEPVGDPNARMTPAVRRLLREHGLDAAQVAGTGGGGRITRADVLAHVEALSTGATPVAPTAAEPTAAAPTSIPPAQEPKPATPAPAAAAPGPITFPPGVDELVVPMT